jgi:hypothetical protein
MAYPVTAFAETSALLAVMEGRTSDACRIIAGMTDSERAVFSRQLSTLAVLTEPGQSLTLTTDATTSDAGDALRGIYGRLAECRSGGDEWASEFLAEDWDYLVPEDLRRSLGIDDD